MHKTDFVQISVG